MVRYMQNYSNYDNKNCKMINWCSYCQQFQGESPPYNNYSITHGICPSCTEIGLDISDEQFARIQNLVNIQKKLFDAGFSGAEDLAKKAITEAKMAGLQPVDLLMGIITPLLWKVGDLWESGKITVADEHRFTKVYDVIVAQIEEGEPANECVDVLFLNAPANTHYLGLRVLKLWLRSKGIESDVLRNCGLEFVVSEIVKRKPRYLGFSVAANGQLAKVLKLSEQIQKRLGPAVPQIVIGGGVIKRGDFKNSSGIIYQSDIHEFLKLLEAKQLDQKI